MKNTALLSSLLIIVVLCAALVRLIGLGSNPPEMTWDEVAWGYNAYALGIDGRDEFGKYLPIQYLESFGDYKPPVYAYLAILPIKIFGLTAFATRLPSALAGIGTVIMAYFLILRLFPQSKNKFWYALSTSAVLALTPWNIMLSRAAFEANVATFFIIAGAWAFFAGIAERKWLLPLSAILFVIPFYTFNSPRVFIPLFLILLVIGFWRKLWQRKKQFIIAVILSVVLLAPLVPFLFSPQAKIRYNEVNIFTDASIVQTSNQEIANDHNSIIGKLINNRRVLYSLSFLKHYLDEFSPTFLFFSGDINPKFSIQTSGEFFIWCMPFLLIGGYSLFRYREGYWWVVPIWLLLAIIPAATARETPHALRSEVVLPMFQFIIGYGVVHFLLFVGNRRLKLAILWKSITGLLVILIIFEFVVFLHSYIVHYPVEFSQEWQYGYKSSIAFVEQHQQQYDQINITDSLGRPYIYYLFYLKYPPQEFRQNASVERDVFGFVTINKFDKYYFGHDLQAIAANNKSNLFIENPTNIPKNAKFIQTFYALDHQPVLVAYTK